MGRDRIEHLSRLLGQELIKRGYNLISGLGLGIGSAVIMGALETAYADQRINANDRLLLRPFPQVAPSETTKEEFNRKHRETMISNAGFAIFVCGNKLGADGKTTIIADGVLDEFEIVKKLGKYPIPVGASGHAAKVVWDEVCKSPARFYPGRDVRPYLDTLGDVRKSDQELIDAIFAMMKLAAGR